MNGFDPRLRSPAQLAIIGGLLAALAWLGLLGPAGRAAFYAGVGLLLVAAVSWMIQPHHRTAYWRGRPIDMGDSLSWWERLYYRIYRG